MADRLNPRRRRRGPRTARWSPIAGRGRGRRRRCRRRPASDFAVVVAVWLAVSSGSPRRREAGADGGGRPRLVQRRGDRGRDADRAALGAHPRLGCDGRGRLGGDADRACAGRPAAMAAVTASSTMRSRRRRRRRRSRSSPCRRRGGPRRSRRGPSRLDVESDRRGARERASSRSRRGRSPDPATETLGSARGGGGGADEGRRRRRGRRPQDREESAVTVAVAGRTARVAVSRLTRATAASARRPGHRGAVGGGASRRPGPRRRS